MIFQMTGGNYEKPFAFIVVTYPSGSVCTCSNGSITLTATDTGGSFVFNIPSAGTWTVTSTDGAKTKSQSVNITSKGQSQSIALTYWDGTLYYQQNMYTEITGGFTTTSPATWSYSGNNVYINRNGGNGSNCFKTLNALNFNEIVNDYGFTKLCTNIISHSVSTAIGIYDASTRVTYARTESTGILTLDITSFISQLYVCVYPSNSTTANSTISKIWLE